ncbi:hypothetical protein GCM10010211_34840 [Streptomyces albospinus]|uniref:GrpB family protein n=1 Tax=Streptomyces albospinus TaxID=285515 RepID=A0ABQ2V3E5_9ACTN|nr:hypothetical protein GCM10010211_34840 [Streptomyces albospinus]
MPFADERHTVTISAYRPTWPEEFELLAARLRAALGDQAVAVDHVGSTSVPGLPAKDCIDVQVRMRSLDTARDAVDGRDRLPVPSRALERHGNPFRPPLRQARLRTACRSPYLQCPPTGARWPQLPLCAAVPRLSAGRCGGPGRLGRIQAAARRHPYGAAVGGGIWCAAIAGLSVYAARQPVARLEFGRRHGAMIAAWGLLYVAVLVPGMIWFQGAAVWWVSGAVLVALPGLIGGYLEARR